MASNLVVDVSLDRALRIQTWREEAFPHDIDQSASVTTQLCVGSLSVYRRSLRYFSQHDTLEKATLTRLTRTYEALGLWAHGYDIVHGGLDEALLASRRARRCYFESLTSLCSTLLSRLLSLHPVPGMEEEIAALRRTLESAVVCLEETYQDGDSMGSVTSQRSSKLAKDDIDEIISDMDVDVDGLIAMDSLITCPADRTKENPRGSTLTTWAPHLVIYERVANRFPRASVKIVQLLGQATWDSFLGCKELREMNQLGGDNGEATGVVADRPAREAKTVTTAARSKDSGLGSSLPTSYAETIMSYQRQGGESVKVPPLPKTAPAGIPFDCVVCGANIVARSNSAWKAHLFKDLRPYICVFEPCSSTVKPFENRVEWFIHVAHHFIEPGAKPEPPYDVTCPLCHEQVSGQHTQHLGDHLEEIALGAVALHAEVGSDQKSVATDEEGGPEPGYLLARFKNCFCDKPPSSQTIFCSNGSCPYRFFHLSCLGLTNPPEGVWHCPECIDNKPAGMRNDGSPPPHASAVCDDCGFIPKGDPLDLMMELMRHREEQHPAAGPRVYACDFPGCPVRYEDRPEELRQHQIVEGHLVRGQRPVRVIFRGGSTFKLFSDVPDTAAILPQTTKVYPEWGLSEYTSNEASKGVLGKAGEAGQDDHKSQGDDVIARSPAKPSAGEGSGPPDKSKVAASDVLSEVPDTGNGGDGKGLDSGLVRPSKHRHPDIRERSIAAKARIRRVSARGDDKMSPPVKATIMSTRKQRLEELRAMMEDSDSLTEPGKSESDSEAETEVLLPRSRRSSQTPDTPQEASGSLATESGPARRAPRRRIKLIPTEDVDRYIVSGRDTSPSDESDVSGPRLEPVTVKVLKTRAEPSNQRSPASEGENAQGQTPLPSTEEQLGYLKQSQEDVRDEPGAATSPPFLQPPWPENATWIRPRSPPTPSSNSVRPRPVIRRKKTQPQSTKDELDSFFAPSGLPPSGLPLGQMAVPRKRGRPSKADMEARARAAAAAAAEQPKNAPAYAPTTPGPSTEASTPHMSPPPAKPDKKARQPTSLVREFYACEACRHFRARCTHTDPCKRCADRNIPCIRRSPSKLRELRPAPRSPTRPGPDGMPGELTSEFPDDSSTHAEPASSPRTAHRNAPGHSTGSDEKTPAGSSGSNPKANLIRSQFWTCCTCHCSPMVTFRKSCPSCSRERCQECPVWWEDVSRS